VLRSWSWACSGSGSDVGGHYRGPMASTKTPGGRRQWFLRPLWRDPSFYFCFVLSVVLYAAMAPALWRYVTNTAYAIGAVAYFFLIWFLVCAIVSIPIRTIRGYWRGKEESDERDRDPAGKRTTTQAAIRVSGRMLGRHVATRQERPTGTGD